MSKVSIKNSDKLSKQKDFFENTPIWKLLFKLAAPTILMFFTIALYGIIDTILATQLTEGYYKDADTAVIAIGYALTYIAIVQTFTLLVNVGAIIHYSGLVSKNKQEEAITFIGSTISGSLIFNMVVALFAIAISKPVILLISGSNNSSQDINAAVLYSQIGMLTVVIFGLYDLLIRYLRTMGKPGISSLIGISGIPINLLFDYIFMGVLNMGIEGGAIASIIGYSFTLTFAILYILRDKSKNPHHIIFTKWKNLKPNFHLVLVAMTLGFPAFFRNIFLTIDNFAFSSFTNSIQIDPNNLGLSGPEADYNAAKFLSTATSVYNQLSALITSIMRGITQGAVAILSYHYSKENYTKVKEGIKWMFIYMFFIIIFVSAITYPLLPSLSSLLTNNKAEIYTKGYLNYAIAAMITSTFLYGILLILYGFLNSTKQISNSIIASLISSIFIFFIVVPLMSNYANWSVSVWSLAITNFIAIIVLMPWFYFLLKNMANIHDKRKILEKKSRLFK